MSKAGCNCPEREKPAASRKWAVLQRQCNHSAFNGYHYTRSDWSEIICNECRRIWRTKARYVDEIPDETKEQAHTRRYGEE